MVSAARVFALVALLGLVPVGARAGGGAALERGRAAIRAGDAIGAVRAFAAALAEAPSPATHFLLAQAYHGAFLKTGLYYRETVEAYEAVVETLGDGVPPGSPRHLARLFLGQVLLRGGEGSRAAEQVRAFLAAHPGHYAREEAWNSLGVALYDENDYEGAVKAFEQALRGDPTHGPARFNLRSVFTRLSLFDQAMANRRAGRLDLTLTDLDQLLRLAPRFGPAHLQRGLVLTELGRVAEAEAQAGSGLDLVKDPRVRFALHDLRGDLRSRRGDEEGALEDYRRCLRIFPGYVQVADKIDGIEKRAAEAAAPPDPGEGEAAPSAGVQTPVSQFPL